MNERAIFDAALEILDPERRRACLDQLCGTDAVLRTRIEALLESHERSSQFLNVPAVEQFKSTTAPTEQPTTKQPNHGDAWHGLCQDDDSDGEMTAVLDLSYLSPSSKPDSIGTLGHYEILAVLGQGAFGIVFKAFDENLHRLVAIKVLNPQMAATSPPRKRFLREARSVAAIRHENIVQVYSVEEQPLPYLVMEYIDGQTLQQKLDGTGPLEVPEILQISRQLAAGLAAAHAKGLIHRDIKPGNILLEKGAEQRVKITDFGLARAADDASLTRTGLISGTPMYMAPEQANGLALDHRTDIFSLGSVLYVMASGRPPFRADKPVAVLKRVTDETPRPIQEIIPEVPNWLCAIITKLHSKKREDRFQSAQEVADLLARCQSELQHHGRVESPGDVFPMVPKAPNAAKSEASASDFAPNQPMPVLESRPSRRLRWAAATAIILALIVGTIQTEATDPDHKAAKYVLSIGGIIRVHGLDREINAVADLPQKPFELSVIILRGNQQVTDKGLADCSFCKQLEHLDLAQTPVTDAGLAHFQDCTSLSSLQLGGTKVTDTGLAYFKNSRDLAILSLTETRVSDAAVADIIDYKNLTHLYLKKTKITAAGIDGLTKALPTCKIEWDGGVNERKGPVPPKVASFVPLFNGKDLTGWHLRRNRGEPRSKNPGDFGTWKVESGVLSGRGPGNVLLTVRDDFENFHLRTEARINWTSNSGIQFRLQRGNGYQAEMTIHEDPRYPAKTGSLTGTRRSDRFVRKNIVVADQWFTHEVIAVDNHIIIKVNGQITVDVRDEEREFTRGRLGLEAGGHAGGTVQFRKIEIKELPPTAASP